MILNVDGIDCHFDSVQILDDVTFSVKGGEILGVLGPNGSGKTTLLRNISGVHRPSKGVVLLNNKDLFSLNPVEVARQLAFVPQESSILFSFSALEIVLMGRNPHIPRFRMEGARDIEIARKSMEQTGTLHLSSRPITELSGGEKQRVVIARCLAQEPEVLLLDEPTLHLDINYQLEVMDLVRKLCREEGLAVVVVLHDINLAARYCDRILLLKKGRIVSAGSMDEVLTSENIREVYEVNTVVKRNTFTGSLFITPVSTKNIGVSSGLSAHLICGAGTGTGLMRALKDDGYELSAGVLNVLDTDFETAQTLGIPIASEAPFSPITEDAYNSNMEMIADAGIVVLTSIPFGSSNMGNLTAAEEALERGTPVYVIEDTPITQRDFSKGEATRRLTRLKEKGARFVSNQKELLSALSVSDPGLNGGLSKAPHHIRPKPEEGQGDGGGPP